MRYESRDYEHNLSDYVSDLRPPGSGNLAYRILCDRVRLQKMWTSRCTPKETIAVSTARTGIINVPLSNDQETERARRLGCSALKGLKCEVSFVAIRIIKIQYPELKFASFRRYDTIEVVRINAIKSRIEIKGFPIVADGIPIC